MKYTIIDMLAEDVNAPEIGNPVIWNNKPIMKKLRSAATMTVAGASAILSTLTALTAR